MELWTLPAPSSHLWSNSLSTTNRRRADGATPSRARNVRDAGAAVVGCYKCPSTTPSASRLVPSNAGTARTHRRRRRVDDCALTPGRPQAVVDDLSRTTGESVLPSMLLRRWCLICFQLPLLFCFQLACQWLGTVVVTLTFDWQYLGHSYYYLLYYCFFYIITLWFPLERALSFCDTGTHIRT